MEDEEYFCPPPDPKDDYEVWEVGDDPGDERMMFRGPYRNVASYIKQMPYYTTNLRFGETIFGIPLVALGQISHVELRRPGGKDYSTRQREQQS